MEKGGKIVMDPSRSVILQYQNFSQMCILLISDKQMFKSKPHWIQ